MPFFPTLILFFATFISKDLSSADKCPFSNCLKCSEDSSNCTKCVNGYHFSREENNCIYLAPCERGEYKNSSNGQCLRCEGSCLTCWGKEEYQCYTCLDGYYRVSHISGYQKCVTCPEAFCRKCSGETGECIECVSGYRLNNLSSKCEACKQIHCDECNNDEDYCNECRKGYVSVEGKCIVRGECKWGAFAKDKDTCEECHSSCSHCFGPGPSDCFDCIDGYYFDMETCLICDSSCRTCKYNKDFCESCPAGSVLRGHRCVKECDTDEYYDLQEKRCKNCDPVCSRCLNSFSNCLDCANEVLYDYNNNTHTCVPTCHPGYFLKFDKDLDEYAEALFSYFLEKINQLNMNMTSAYCAKCSENCKECLLSGTYCTDCQENRYLYLGKCLEDCPRGYFKDILHDTGRRFCGKCAPFCEKCANEYKCEVCNQLFTLNNGDCYVNQIRTGDCEKNEIAIIDGICAKSCPPGSDPIENTCECQDGCAECKLDLTKFDVFCDVCFNKDDWISHGKCFAECPKELFRNTGKVRKTCQTECPENFKALFYPQDIKYCVDSCPKQYREFGNICFSPSCELGYYLNNEKLKAFLANKTLEKDVNESMSQEDLLEFYRQKVCEKCQTGCAECTGPNNENCKLCSTGYLQMNLGDGFKISEMEKFSVMTSDQYILQQILKSFLESDVFKKNSASCVPQCSQGWVPINENLRICVPCLVECPICAKGMFRFKLLCTFSCPENTLSNETSRKCEQKIIKQIPTLKIKSYTATQTITSTNHDTPLDLFITNQFMDAMDIMVDNIACTLSKGENGNSGQFNEEQQIFVQIKGITFDKYSTRIPSSLLLPNGTYTVKCIVNLTDATMLEDKVTLKTAKLPTGVFKITPNNGTALETNFSFKISSWNQEDYPFFPFTYQIYYKLDDKFLNWGRYYDTTEGSRISLEENFTFPYLNETKDITVFLKVSNLLSELEIGQVISLGPTSLSFINDKLDNIDNLDLNVELAHVLSKSLLNMYENQLFEERNSKEEEMKKSIKLNFYEYPCDSKKDCSGNGKCITTVTNIKIKCMCYDGWNGRSCSWPSKDFIKAQKFIRKAMKSVEKVVSSPESFEKNLNILTSITKFEDLYNKETLNSSLNIFGALTSFAKEHENALEMLSIMSNLIEIIKSTKGDMTPDEKKLLRDKFRKILDEMLNNAAKKLEQSSLSELALDFPNIKGRLESISKYFNNSAARAFVFNFSEINAKIIIPDDMAEYLRFHSSNVYAQALTLPSIIFTNDSSENPIRFFTDTLSFEFKLKKTQAKLISGLKNNITLSIPKLYPVIPLQNKFFSSEVYFCSSYITDDGVWNTSGLVYVGESNNSIECNSSHLSVFSVILTNNQTLLNSTLLPNIDITPEVNTPNRNPISIQFGMFTYFTILNVILLIIYLVARFISKSRINSAPPNLNAKNHHFAVVQFTSPAKRGEVILENIECVDTFTPQRVFETHSQSGSPDHNETETENSSNVLPNPEKNKDFYSFHPLISVLVHESKFNPKERRLFFLQVTFSVEITTFLLLNERAWLFFLPISWASNYLVSESYNYIVNRSRIPLSIERIVAIGLILASMLGFTFGVIFLSNYKRDIGIFILVSFIDSFILDSLVLVFVYLIPSSRCFFGRRGFYIP